jgi:hypothetical protein
MRQQCGVPTAVFACLLLAVGALAVAGSWSGLVTPVPCQHCGGAVVAEIGWTYVDSRGVLMGWLCPCRAQPWLAGV